MLGSDLRPDRPTSANCQVIDLAGFRRGRAASAPAAIAPVAPVAVAASAGFAVGDRVVSAVDWARGAAEIGLIAALPRAPHGRAIVQFNGCRRALHLAELQPVPESPVCPCDVEGGPRA